MNLAPFLTHLLLFSSCVAVSGEEHWNEFGDELGEDFGEGWDATGGVTIGDMKPLREALAAADEVWIYEGLPHQDLEPEVLKGSVKYCL